MLCATCDKPRSGQRRLTRKVPWVRNVHALKRSLNWVLRRSKCPPTEAMKISPLCGFLGPDSLRQLECLHPVATALGSVTSFADSTLGGNPIDRESNNHKLA